MGDKEAEADAVNVRTRGQEKAEGSVKVEAFVDRVKGLIESKSAHRCNAPSSWRVRV